MEAKRSTNSTSFPLPNISLSYYGDRFVAGVKIASELGFELFPVIARIKDEIACLDAYYFPSNKHWMSPDFAKKVMMLGGLIGCLMTRPASIRTGFVESYISAMEEITRSSLEEKHR